MYLVELYMKVLEGYTKNQYWLEASNVERYIVEECIEFCSQYIETIKSIRIPETRYDWTWGGKGTWGYNVVTMTQQEVSQAHLYILNNTTRDFPI